MTFISGLKGSLFVLVAVGVAHTKTKSNTKAVNFVTDSTMLSEYHRAVLNLRYQRSRIAISDSESVQKARQVIVYCSEWKKKSRNRIAKCRRSHVVIDEEELTGNDRNRKKNVNQ